MRSFLVAFLLLSITTIKAQVKAQDGRIYKTVKIGDQTWMAENLDVATYRNGDSIPQVQDPKAWSSLKTGAWCYYGGNAGSGAKYGKLYNWYAITDPRGLAPEGWHIPSDEEWTKLTAYLGGKIQASAKIKSPRGWSTGGNGSNETGFSALPGGTRSINEAFSFAGDYGYWWTNTTFDDYSAWNRFLAYNNNYIGRSTGWKQFGNSVRCVKNENNLASVEGQLLKEVKESEKEAGAITPDFARQTTIVKETVKVPSMIIGNKVWMTQNLDADKFQNGDPIPEAKTAADWQKAIQLKQPAWCYYNNDSTTGKQYGKLYNWYAIHDARGLAPIGWHIPVEIEWHKLADQYGGGTSAGGALKSNGFDKLLSGFRDVDGSFRNDGLVSYWWAATESSATGAWCFSVTYFSSAFNSDNSGDKGKGFSVRCVKD